MSYTEEELTLADTLAELDVVTPLRDYSYQEQARLITTALAKRRVQLTQFLPSQVESVSHCRNHLEFRSDCEQCVSAREFG